MRQYSHETSLQNWQRGAEIQDYQYLNTLKQYEKNINISSDQLGLNQTSANQAIQSEDAAVEDMFLQQQFQRESALAALKSVYTEGSLGIKEQGSKLFGIQSNQRLGSAAINNQIDQLMKEGSFAKTNAMVEGLMKEGRAAMGQAGKSKAKRQQSASAALNRGLMQLESELTGKRKQAGIELAKLNAETSLAKTGVGLNLERIENSITSAEADAKYNNEVMTANMKSFISQTERNIKDIELQKQVADLNVRESTMIKPERLSYDPVPQLPPERIFVERMEAIPGFVPQAAQQNVWAPLIQGIAQGASTVVYALEFLFFKKLTNNLWHVSDTNLLQKLRGFNLYNSLQLVSHGCVKKPIELFKVWRRIFKLNKDSVKKIFRQCKIMQPIPNRLQKKIEQLKFKI